MWCLDSYSDYGNIQILWLWLTYKSKVKQHQSMFACEKLHYQRVGKELESRSETRGYTTIDDGAGRKTSPQ